MRGYMCRRDILSNFVSFLEEISERHCEITGVRAWTGWSVNQSRLQGTLNESSAGLKLSISSSLENATIASQAFDNMNELHRLVAEVQPCCARYWPCPGGQLSRKRPITKGAWGKGNFDVERSRV